jgi:hypothetical protein
MENEAVRYEVPDAAAEQATGLAFILKDLQTNEFLRESARAAELVQSHLKEVHNGPDRGVKQAGFAVLNTARRPAVLVELGFSTNPDDAELMTTSRGQRALASSIADAIVAYLREFERRTGEAPVEARRGGSCWWSRCWPSPAARGRTRCTSPGASRAPRSAPSARAEAATPRTPGRRPP